MTAPHLRTGYCATGSFGTESTCGRFVTPVSGSIFMADLAMFARPILDRRSLTGARHISVIRLEAARSADIWWRAGSRDRPSEGAIRRKVSAPGLSDGEDVKM